MSVRTTADENRDNACQYLREATKALAEIVIDECYGTDDYCPEYRKILQRVMYDTVELKGMLENFRP